MLEMITSRAKYWFSICGFTGAKIKHHVLAGITSDAITAGSGFHWSSI
jgi:hypothetical protein